MFCDHNEMISKTLRFILPYETTGIGIVWLAPSLGCRQVKETFVHKAQTGCGSSILSSADSNLFPQG
jgi:hypothetical protein